ncbi:hypothetical protein GBAR_LOCUS1235, partial [Geodia barretti]
MAGSEKTTVVPTDDSFTVPLCLWQRAAFLSSAPGPSTSGSRAAGGGPGSSGGERDSLRLRIAQLKHEYWRDVSRGVQPLHVERLAHSLTESYCTAMDSSDGVESIAAPVKVLTASRKKESGQWKSEISLETLLSFPGVRPTDRDKSVEELPLECVPVVSDSVSDRQRPDQPQNSQVQASSSLTQPPPPPLQPHSLVPPRNHIQLPLKGATRSGIYKRLLTTVLLASLFVLAGKFPYSAPCSNSSGMVGNGKGMEGERRQEEEDEDDDDDDEPTDK